MTIQLHDLHQAVLDYLSTVLVTTVQQVQPAPNSPGTINPNEIATFSVKIDNTGDDTNGVPLINLRHHFKFDSDVGAKFIVPDFGIARTGTSTSDSKIDALARVKEYVLFPDTDTLDFNHHARRRLGARRRRLRRRSRHQGGLLSECWCDCGAMAPQSIRSSEMVSRGRRWRCATGRARRIR